LARKPAEQSVHRDDIIMAAADVLQRNGYESTTMKDIAAQVNLTAASLYHHFRNKDALLLAVLEAGLEQAIEHIEPLLATQKSAADKLRQMVALHVVSLTENTAFGAAMVFEIRTLMNMKTPYRNGSDVDVDAQQEFIARRDAFFVRRDYFEELFRRVVREGIERGEFKTVNVPIFIKMMLGAHNWVGVWYRSTGQLNGEQIASIFADSFLDGLLTKHS
jgi:TetR/AcrR family transcriptional regulator, cholesterol catabolism regulator